jgi:hypothetical protein
MTRRFVSSLSFPLSLFSTPGLVLIAVMITGLWVPVGAIQDQTPFCPTESELIALFPWGGPVYWADKDGSPYTYRCEASDYTQANENGRAYQNFKAESYVDRISASGSVQKNAVKSESIQQSVEIIEYLDDLYDDVTVEEWRQSEDDGNGRIVFHDVHDIGDKAYAVSKYWDYKESNRDVFNTKFMRLCFLRNGYYVQVTLTGASESLIGTMGGLQSPSDKTAELYPSDNCVPTLETISAIARIIDQKIQGGRPDTRPLTRDYGELIWMLKYYMPTLFDGYSDQTLYQALVLNESGSLGADQGITYRLKDNMMDDIHSFKKTLSEPVPTRQTRLIDPISGRNILQEDLDEAMEIVSLADSYLKVADTVFGYVTENPLNLGPVVDLLGYYHELETQMKYARDAIVIPDFATQMYLEYKKGRASHLNPQEAFDQALYQEKKSSDSLTGEGWYAIRSYGDFAKIPDDAKVEAMVMERFEARYHEEEMVDLHAIWLANEDVFIRGIMWKYFDKLQRLARTCQALKDGVIQSDVVYTPQKWQYLPPELRGTPQ